MKTDAEPPLPALLARSYAAGLLMGIGNVVPGIPGGTMLVAMGVYARFIEALSQVTRFRFRVRSVLHLAAVGCGALTAIALLAKALTGLVADYRWVMYSIFLGLSLGGAPILYRLANRGSVTFRCWAAVGFLAMVGLAVARPAAEGAIPWWTIVAGGSIAASAAILPGIDGSYLLLVLGQYETVLGALDQATRREFADAATVLVPFAVGAVLAVAGLSNLLRWLLRRHDQPALGTLMGFVLGSVVGIYPFQEAAAPGAAHAYFPPAPWQVGVALALVALGFLATLLIDRFGRQP
jgi:putative membrane protein